jgi:hypothetical protein
MLRTTININLDVLVEITAAAIRLEVSRRKLIVRLLMRIMRDISRYQGEFTLVKYQPYDPLGRWHHFPIVFRKDENEFFTDLRKFSKYSVSYLVAIAVREYLPEILAEQKKSRHNYSYNEWALGLRMVRGALCWEIFWGDPVPDPRNAPGEIILRRTASGAVPLRPPADSTLH